MEFFKNLNVRGKLVVILFTTTLLTLSLFAGVFVYNDVQNLKKVMVGNMNTLAGTTGANIRAALVFRDQPTALRILSIMKETPQILFATIYDAEGEIFASYSKRQGQTPPKPMTSENGHIFEENHFELVRSIFLQGETIGRIFLYAHLGELNAQLKNFWTFVGLAMLGSLGFSFLLAILFQGVISSPILSLAETAKRVSRQTDYSIRAQSHDSNDEIKTLYSGFNEMLSQIQKRDHELKQYRDSLEDMVREAQEELVRRERLAALGELSAKVSHELRNPLGTIRNVIFALDQDISKEDYKARRMLNMAERNVVRCDGIIEELLDYARPKKLKLKRVELDPWLSEVLEEHVFNKEITVTTDFHSGCLVRMAPESLRRAVINVLQNASHALMEKYYDENENGRPGNPDHYRLEVKTRTAGDNAELLVRDTAHGIPEEIIEKIFEPLFSTKGFGVGLGLPIVQEIMQQHHGAIRIESEPDKGTEVVLTLPRLKDNGLREIDSSKNGV